jgi:hypothetical protein
VTDAFLLRPLLALFLTYACVSTCLAIEPQQVMELPRPEVEHALPSSHPMAYSMYSSRLFHEGDREDALFWYYVGELRYRFFLAANPKLPPDGAPALFASLHESVGSVVWEWGKSSPETAVKELQRALDWDASTDNGVTSNSSHRKEWQGVRDEYSQVERNRYTNP